MRQTAETAIFSPRSATVPGRLGAEATFLLHTLEASALACCAVRAMQIALDLLGA